MNEIDGPAGDLLIERPFGFQSSSMVESRRVGINRRVADSADASGWSRFKIDRFRDSGPLEHAADHACGPEHILLRALPTVVMNEIDASAGDL